MKELIMKSQKYSKNRSIINVTTQPAERPPYEGLPSLSRHSRIGATEVRRTHMKVGHVLLMQPTRS